MATTTLSRFDRFVRAIGGEQNLPPQLPPPPPIIDLEPEDEDSEDEYIEPVTDQGEWWNQEPPSRRPPPKTASQGKLPPQFFSPEKMEAYPFDPRKDEPAPLGLNFCPLVAVTKFPYKKGHLNEQHWQAVATAFFDEQKVWFREWEVYYIYSDHFESAKPPVFIPEYQLLALINEINEAIPEAEATIPDWAREQGLVLNFDDMTMPNLRPRFLGNSGCKDQVESWQMQLQQAGPTPDMEAPSTRTLEAFKEKMQLAAEASKNQSRAKKAKKQSDNLVKRQDMVRMLIRTQQYLGIAPTTDQKSDTPDSPTQNGNTPNLSDLSISSPVPNLFNNDVIFISIDVEAWEEQHKPITEVGIATLDTRDLRTLAPGANGSEWQKAIRARHFLIKEEMRHVNHRFGEGCPDKFEFNNHKSEITPFAQIGKAITNCFSPPYSNCSPSMKDKLEKRKVVLVGQDINQDISYLKQLGISITSFTCIADTVDTASLFRVYTKEANSRSLGHILFEFDLMGWHLHNAGNDAVYTLWAMMAICLKKAEEESSDDEREKAKEKHEKRMQAKTEAAVESAKEGVKHEAEGWESTGSDGGMPVLPSEPVEGKKGKVLYTSGGNVLDV